MSGHTLITCGAFQSLVKGLHSGKGVTFSPSQDCDIAEPVTPLWDTQFPTQP